MRVKTFEAENFRNIRTCRIEFPPGITLIEGENAQGKTNAVEGIYYFARGRSFRTAEEKDMIAFGNDGMYLSMTFSDGAVGGDSTFSYTVAGREKKRMLNGYRLTKTAEMIGKFRAVLFVPDDLRMVKAGPEERRAFLNVALSQTDPSYVRYYTLYKKALENRNFLLRRASKGEYADRKEIEAWSESLADYGSRLHLSRVAYLHSLARYAGEFQQKISDGKETLSLFYESHIDPSLGTEEDVRNAYLTLLTANTERECAAGTTLYGVHRDDIAVSVNGQAARQFASQGQQRSVVLSMKLAEGEVSRDRYGEYPVYLFDDVLSELDGERRRFLIEEAVKSDKGEKQIIVTSCEKEIPDLKTDGIIRVEGGKYRAG